MDSVRTQYGIQKFSPREESLFAQKGINHPFILLADYKDMYLVVYCICANGGAHRPSRNHGSPLRVNICYTHSPNTEGIPVMLYTIAVILVVLWLLGLVTSYTMGGFVHILLVLAVIAIVYNLFSGRKLT